jgi:thiamine biosynthesis lipoprotein
VSARAYPLAASAPRVEHRRTFACFGGECTVIVADAARPAEAAAAVAMAKRALLDWHQRFSRFEADSELSRLNRDPRSEVPVSPLMARLIAAAARAAQDTGGLVDATLGAELERAGYASHMAGDGIPPQLALPLAPARAPAAANPADRWHQIAIERHAGVVTRPPGTRIDLGGIAKGVFADELGSLLTGFDAFALDCAGDIRVGGRQGMPRAVHVESPFDRRTLHTFELAAGAVATSGIGRRSWTMVDGRPAHHLIDPRTGRPAFTGIVQATALAPTAAQAEVLAKAALLSGPGRAQQWLSHGGLVVEDDGSYEALEADTSRSMAGACEPNQPQMSSSTCSRSGSLRISWNRPS